MRLWKIETADGSILFVHAPSSGEASDIANSWLSNKGSFDRVSATSLSGPGTVGVPGADVLTRGSDSAGTPISVGKISAVNKLSFYENLASGSSIDFRNAVRKVMSPMATPGAAYDPSDFPEFDWWGQDPLPPADGNGGNGGNGGGGFDASDIDQSLRREAFEFGPGFEAGLRQRNINIGPGGGLEGRIAQSRQRALEDRFYTQQALQPGSGLTIENAFPTFQSFLSGRTGGGDTFTNPLFGQAGAQAARGLLNQARGFTAPASQALPSDLAGGVLNPATIGQGQTLANVALEAGRQRFGSLSRFLPGAQDLSQSFLSQDRPMPGTFADYLNQRIFG
jgi:hypothetical protein